MIKTLAKAQQQERVKFRVPRSVQDAIPIRRIWSDGIFLCGNQYSKTWSFTDINYAIAGKDDKTAMFLDYSELLNTLPKKQKDIPQKAGSILPHLLRPSYADNGI